MEPAFGTEGVCGEYVTSLSFAPDGSGFAAGCGNGEVRIFAADGRWKQTAGAQGNWVNAITYSPDSKVIAVAAQNKEVWIYEPIHGWLLTHLSGHTANIKKCCL